MITVTDRKHWSTSTDYKLYEKLRALSKRTRIPVSKLLDEAIEDLLSKHQNFPAYEYTPAAYSYETEKQHHGD